MVTNRVPLARATKTRLTPEIIECYRRMRALHDDDPTRSAECIALNGELHQLLGRAPWQTTIMDTLGDDVAPAWMFSQGLDAVVNWNDAHSIRKLLDQAVSI